MEETSKTREDLLEEVRALRRQIGELQTSLCQAEEERKRWKEKCDKRVKELNFLYTVSSLVGKPQTSLEEILYSIITLIPSAWQYPEITCARAVINGHVVTSAHFKETPWKQEATVKVNEKAIGTLEVYYLEEKPETDEGPFLREERNLLNAIADRLGKIIERDHIRDAQLESEDKYRSHFSNVSDVIYSIGSDFTILNVSPSVERLLGYTPEELIGKPITDLNLLTENSLKKALSDTMRVLSGEIINSSVYEFIAKDGSHKVGEVSGAPLFKDNKIVSVISVARDITDRTRAEEELRKTKDYLDNIIESSLDSIVVTDSMGCITRVNKAFLKLLGYTPEEVIGKHILAFSPAHEGRYMSSTSNTIDIGKEFFVNSRAIISQRLVEEEKISNWETYLINKDGIIIPVEENIVFLHDSEGNRIGAVGFIRNITERKKSEGEKSGMEARLQNKVIELSLMNEISEVLLSTRELNEILHIILIGATAYQALGFNRAFLFLINPEETMLEGKVATGPLNAEEAYRIWKKLAEEQHSLKELLLSRHGKLSQEDIPINNLVQQIRIPLKEKESIFTKAVYENQSFNIVDGSHHPLMDKDFLSQLGTESFALVPLAARGKPLGVLLADNFINRKPITDEDVKRLRAFANHASLAIENSNLYQHLEEKVLELSKAYHELRDNRDKLLRYERLSAVGNVAARITHEIRNPLVAIGGFARRILKREQDSEVNRNYVKIIIEEIDRLEHTLNSILSFTKPSAPHCSPLNINGLTKTTLEVMGIEIERSNIRVEEHYDQSIPQLWADEHQLRQVLINLIRNAIQAMPEGGVLTVRTAKDDSYIRIEIADTGVGISDEDMDKLFDAFFTSKSTGSGLGLTVSAQIINNHGGTIEVRKREPKGTTFIVKLPLHPVPQQVTS